MRVIGKVDRFFGAGQWEWGVFDGQAAVWRRPGGINEEMLAYLRHTNAAGRHIFLRPTEEREPRFMLLDDLDSCGVQFHKVWQAGRGLDVFRPGRMVVMTSPDNYQVWIRSDRDLSLDEKSYWLARCGSDPGAAPLRRWGRAPGFRNCKPKHANAAGRFPLSRLIWVDWGKDASIPPLPHLPQGGACVSSCRADGPFQAWTYADGQVTTRPVSGTAEQIRRADFDRGDESATDFAFALALMRRGYQVLDVRERILRERDNWTNHQGERRRDGYLNRTLRRAAAVIDGGA